MDSGRGQNPPEPQWWQALPPAEATVTCGEREHVIRWADGMLTLPAHPDAEAELVLGALGGESAECIELAQMWGRHTDDLDVLVLGPRSAADQLLFDRDDPGPAGSAGSPGPAGPAHVIRPSGPPASAGLVYMPQAPGPPAPAGPVNMPQSPGPPSPAGPPLRYVAAARAVPAIMRGRGNPVGLTAAAGPGQVFASGVMIHRPAGLYLDPDGRRAGRIELGSLFALGLAFQLRLSAVVAAGLGDQARTGDRAANRPRLAAALTGRLAPAAQEWLGIDPDRVTAAVHEGPGWGRLALSGAGDARSLRASLPLSWLARVWACGLAVVDGHLVVAVRAARWPDAEVLAVPEPGAEPVTLRLRGSQPDGDAGWPRWEVAGPGGEAGRR